MSFNVKSEILSAIAKTDAPETKTLLLLMLGVLEEIGGKIDGFLQDEKQIREKVLNGHEPSHHKHHDWVAERMTEQCDETCTWVKKQMAADDETKAIRAWVAAKMQAEEDAAKANKTTLRKAIDKAVEQGVTIIITAGATLLGVMAYLK